MELSHKRKTELLAGPYTRLLAEHESRLADLYSMFAAAIPRAATFWNRMSEEELAHKKLIETIAEHFRDGRWRFSRPSFVASSIIDSCGLVSARTTCVAKNGISMREALKWAVELERGLFESDFFQVIDADDSQMMNMLQSLHAYTVNHIITLEKEAKRMRWRLFGSRTSGKPERKKGSSWSLHESVKASQAEMIGHLVNIEETVAMLYNTYSDRMEEHAKFWSRLGAEEMQHAAMLRTLYGVLENGNVFYTVAEFSRKKLVSETENLLNLEFEARHKDLSHYTAINHALKIERMLVESGFYRCTESDAPEFKFIAGRMVELSEEHIRVLQEETGKAIDSGILATRPATPLKKQ